MTIEAVKSQAAIGAQRRVITTDEVGADAVANALQSLVTSQSAATVVNGVVKRVTGAWDCSTNTLVDLSPDLDIAIAANEVWQIRYSLSVGDALASTGIRINALVPNGATKLQSATLVTDNGICLYKTSTGAAFSFPVASLTSAVSGKIDFDVTVVNGSTAGTVTFEFCQATLNGSAVTVNINSSAVATRQ